MVKAMMIGQLARETATKVTTIRFYEEIGLLQPAVRNPSGRRTYRASDVERLHFVRNGRRLGFSIEEMRSLIALADKPEEDCAAAAAIAARHLADVEVRLTQLSALRDQLIVMTESCDRSRMADCRVIQAITECGKL